MAVLGTGHNYPLAFNNGKLEYVSDAESVQAGIKHLLDTKPFERFMNPSFGSVVSRLLFEPCSESTASLFELYVTDGIKQFITRINSVTVDAFVDAENHAIQCEINFTLKSGSDRFTFIYPFYLNRN